MRKRRDRLRVKACEEEVESCDWRDEGGIHRSREVQHEE